ncbi:MAG: hypothetical protein ACPHID_04305 [Thermoplasmatota archaeon]
MPPDGPATPVDIADLLSNAVAGPLQELSLALAQPWQQLADGIAGSFQQVATAMGAQYQAVVSQQMHQVLSDVKATLGSAIADAAHDDADLADLIRQHQIALPGVMEPMLDAVKQRAQQLGDELVHQLSQLSRGDTP